MVHRPRTLVSIVLLVVSVLPVSRAGPPECAGLGAAGQELCLNIEETDRTGAPTGADFQFRGPGPATITQTIGDYAVDIVVDLVEGPGGMSLTVSGTFERTGAGNTRIALTAEGGLSNAPLPGVGSLRLEGFSTGTAAVQLGAGAGYDDLGLGDPLYSPFPRICEATLFNAETFDCIEIDQPLREGSIAITIILSVDINDVGTIVDLPAGVGVGDVPAGGIEQNCLDVPTKAVRLCKEIEDVARSETPVFFGDDVAATSFFFQVPEPGGPIDFTIVPQGAPLFGAFFAPVLPPGAGGGLAADQCGPGFLDSFLYPPDVGDTRTLFLEPGIIYVVIHRDSPGSDVPFTWNTHFPACDLIPDCNENGIDDAVDIETETSGDCDGNGVPDECDIASGAADDNDEDGIPDVCFIPDCNENGIDDAVDIETETSGDCDGNGIPDECDIASEVLTDKDGNGIPDECQPSCPDCEICDNGVDDDGNGLVDCDDIACDDFGDCPAEDCGNGIDDDGDGFADCFDTECYADDLCTDPEDCTNGLDDDGDGDIDCADPDCAAAPACQDEICNDGLDNDGDSLIDCLDEDCLLDGPCSTEICDDLVDNDGDGNVDCDDPDCEGVVSCGPEICDDFVDNDGDGLVDCLDPSCLESPSCLGTPYIRCDPSGDGETNVTDTIQIVEGIFLGNVVTTCLATFDCNGDGVPDISDAIYSIVFAMGGGPPPPPPFGACGPGHIEDDCDSFDGCGPEDCFDGIDNNFDGLVDCEDPFCENDGVCIEICDDGVDNDGNGLIDCGDPDCANAVKAPCPSEVCDDRIDNDGDFLVDCDDPDCARDPACRKEVCDDFVDNDGDGAVDCADSDCAMDPKCLLNSGDKIVKDGRGDPSFPGVVVVELANGMLQTVFLKNRYRYMNPTNGVPIEPEITVRSTTFPGTLKDFEQLEVPLARQPAAAQDSIPVPRPDDAHGVMEYRRRVDLLCAQERYVVVTQEGQGNQAVCVIRTYNGLGTLLSTHRKPGTFKKAIYNESTGQKTVVVEKDGMIQWIVFDTVTGNLILSSTFGLQTSVDIVDIEFFGGHIFILEKVLGRIDVRVRIFQSSQTTPLQTLHIPGEFVTATDNGTDTKAVVTQQNGIVMQDLVTLTTNPPSAKGLAQNGIGGTHQHLQHDKSLGRDRFVEVVYNQGRDQTTVRILDGATGTIIATNIFNGKYRHVRKVNGTTTRAPKKIFIVERQGETDAHVVDLNDGRRLSVQTLRGKFQRISVRGGSVTLETKEPSRQTTFRAY